MCIGSLACSAAYYANLRDCAPSNEGNVLSRLSRWWRLRISRPSFSPFAAWAQSNLKNSAVLYGFRLNKMLEAHRRQCSIRRMTSYGTVRRRGPLLSFARTNPDAHQEKQKVLRSGAVHLRASVIGPVSGSRLASGYRESIWRAANPLCQSLQ